MIIKGVKVELINLTNEQHERNEEIAYRKGFRKLCICCGKGIKDMNTTKWVRMVGSGKFYTEDSQQLDPCAYIRWFPIDNTCYKKYKAIEKEIEI